MFFRMFKIILSVFLITIFTINAYAVDISPAQWKMLKKGEVVKWLEPVKGTEVKKGVAIGIVNASPEDIWAVLHQNNDFKAFMPRTIESILVDPSAIPGAVALKFDHNTPDPKALIKYLRQHRAEKMTGTTGYFFSLLNMPWPLVNRWYIIKLEDFVTSGRWFQHWTMVMGNVKTNNGSWELVPLDKGRTLVTYTLFTDPGGSVPDFLINLGTNVTLPGVIEAVRKRVKEEFSKK